MRPASITSNGVASSTVPPAPGTCAAVASTSATRHVGVPVRRNAGHRQAPRSRRRPSRSSAPSNRTPGCRRHRCRRADPRSPNRTARRRTTWRRLVSDVWRSTQLGVPGACSVRAGMACSSTKTISSRSGNLPRLRAAGSQRPGPGIAASRKWRSPERPAALFTRSVMWSFKSVFNLVASSCVRSPSLTAASSFDCASLHDRVDDLVHVDVLGLRDVGDRLAVAQLRHAARRS